MKRLVFAIAFSVMLSGAVFAGEIPSDGFLGTPPGTNRPNDLVAPELTAVCESNRPCDTINMPLSMIEMVTWFLT